MKRNNLSKQTAMFLGGGLFVQNLPFIFGEFLHLNDFLSGFCRGLGLMLIVLGIIKTAKTQKQNPC